MQNRQQDSLLKNLRLNLLKLTLIKLLQQELLDKEILATESIEEIWRIVFRYPQSLSELIREGLIPTTMEMNQCQPDNTNAWHWLASSDARIAVFQALLTRGIVPSAQALEVCSKDDNTNAWYWLAGRDTVAVFQALLTRGIVPSVQALEACSAIDNTNAWRWLASGDARIAVFQALLTRGIVPSAQALEVCSKDDNTNAWYWLAGRDTGVAVFQALLTRDVVPSIQALEVCNAKDNTNAWRRLASSKRFEIFKALLERDILPSAEGITNADFCIIENLERKNTLNFCSQEIMINKIIHQLNAIKELNNNYNIDVRANQVAKLLTHENHLDIYAYLYLFYSQIARSQPTLFLPPEIWLLIGEYILPKTTIRHFEALDSEENRATFTKYHVVRSIDKLNLNPSAFFYSDMMQLKKTIKTNTNPAGELKKCYLSHFGSFNGEETQNIKKPKPLKKSNASSELKTILSEGCILNRFK